MTGRYASHTGVHVPFVDSSPNVLPNDEVLLPQLLKKAGYATHMVGKWLVSQERALRSYKLYLNSLATPSLSHGLCCLRPGLRVADLIGCRLVVLIGRFAGKRRCRESLMVRVATAVPVL